MWKIFILLFYCASITFTYDLEVNLRMDTEFVDKLRSVIHDKDQSASVQFDINVPEELISQLGINKDKLFRALEHKDQTESTNVLNDLTKKGVERLAAVGEKLKQKLHWLKDISPQLQLSSTNYLTKIQEISSNVSKREPDCEVDKQNIILEVVERSNEILYNETHKMIKLFTNDADLLSKEDLDNVKELLDKENLINIKQDFHFICRKLNICRPFPGFSDYVAGLMKEVINMTDSKFHNFVMKVAKVSRTKYKFFGTIFGKKTLKKIANRLQNVLDGELSEVRDLVSAMHSFIINRRKWTFDDDQDMNKKKKAIRILLDVIDKAFELNDEQKVIENFDTTVNAVREWTRGLRNDIETIIFTFYSYAVDILDQYWKKNTKSEVCLLVQMITNGKVKAGKRDYLLQSGSKFVNKVKEQGIKNSENFTSTVSESITFNPIPKKWTV